ncbi:MAG: diguanylate cyclase [Candidatus Cloacimonetes bacterium]|nr:diguanylate cyclase [Candidatus Cloacimonadota bacterium]
MKETLQKLLLTVDEIFRTHFKKCVLFATAYMIFSIFSMNYLGVLEPLENYFMDFRFQSRNFLQNKFPKAFHNDHFSNTSNKVVMVQITEDCLQSIGKWPWDRNQFAQLLKYLSKAQASAIGFDVSFFDQDLRNIQSDLAFIEAIKENKKVVLASELILKHGFTSNSDGSFDLPSLNDISTIKKSIHQNLPHEQFRRFASSHGFVNIGVDDGTVRKVPISKKNKDQIYLSLALETYKTYMDGKDVHVKSETDIFLGQYQIPFWHSNQKANFKDLVFKSSIEDKLFSNYAYVNYLDSTIAAPFHIESVSNILANKVNPAIFKDKIILIGLNAEGGILDKKLTPFGVFPGMEIQATVIDNLLNRSFLHRNSNANILLYLILIAIILYFVNRKFNFAISLIINFIVASIIFVTCLYFFNSHLYIIDFTPILLLIVGQFLLTHFLKLTLSLRKKMLHLETLNTLSNELFTVLDSDKLANSIFEIFKQRTGTDSGVILTIDQNKDTPQFSSFGTTNDEFLVAISKETMRSSLFEHFKLDQTSLLLNEFPEYKQEKLNFTEDHQTLAFPLILNNRAYGAIFIHKRNFSTFLSDFDDHFWQTLCQIIVAALENARLYRLATVDGLTGLYVRSFFDVQINKEFSRAKRYNAELGYLMSDIDHFKNFNDTYGHAVGDQVLRIVADEIKKSVRDADVAARYGGEELCVILPNTDKEGSIIIAERIRQNIEALRIPHETGDIKITCSVGVSCLPDNNPLDVKAFMKEADDALYVAKENGRNQTVFYTKSSEESS